MNPKSIFTLKEAAEYLGISYPTILRLMKKSDLPAFKVGHQWRIRFDDLEKYVKGNSHYYGLVGVKPLFFHPNVLNKYRKETDKYYIKDKAFSGKFGIKEEWYTKFTKDKSSIKLGDVPYRKVRLSEETFIICVDAGVYGRTIALTDEIHHWTKFIINNPSGR